MRLLFLIACSLLITSCAYQATSFESSNVSVMQRFSFIQARILLGQAVLAKQQLDEIDEADQGQVYWRLLSLYWLSFDQAGKAMSVHESALLNYPNDGFILNNYGVLLGMKKRWGEACTFFKKADENSLTQRQTVQINLARCAIRRKDVDLATLYLKQAKEINELPLIGLMTELNLVLIQGINSKARIIFNNIQASKRIAQGSVHFDEYNCLSKQLIAHEADPTLYSSASEFICLNGARY